MLVSKSLTFDSYHLSYCVDVLSGGSGLGIDIITQPSLIFSFVVVDSIGVSFKAPGNFDWLSWGYRYDSL